jgi:hypothetical protein
MARSRGLGDVYKRQPYHLLTFSKELVVLEIWLSKDTAQVLECPVHLLGVLYLD